MTWDPEQLTDEANHLLSSTAANDPRTHDWGFFQYGDAPASCGGGIGVLQWFASLEELLTFVSDYSPAMYCTFDEEEEWNELRDSLRSIASGFRDDPQSCIELLNIELKSLLQITWIGSYDELIQSSKSFCCGVRGWYRNNYDESSAEHSVLAIELDEEQSFREAIPEYGC